MNGTLMQGPVNNELLQDPEWVAKMATKQSVKAEQDYVTRSLDSISLRKKYEKTQQEALKLREELDLYDTPSLGVRRTSSSGS